MDKKLILIESLDSKATIDDNELNFLFSFSSDDGEEVRYRSIQLLGPLDSAPAILNVVRNGLNDKDKLIRVECAEIFGMQKKVLADIKKE